MNIEKQSDSSYEATGRMELSNMTEVKEAISTINGGNIESFLSNNLQTTYKNLKELPIEDLKFKTPFNKDGSGVDYFR